MSTNPYKAPTTPNLDVTEYELEAPPEILKKIKGAWIAGCVSSGITLIVVLIAMSGTSLFGIDAWSLFDVAFMLGLSYGVYRKSRTCAILLLALFVAGKILMWTQTGAPSGLLLAIIFFWLFLQGVIGTFQFHSWKSEQGQAD